jgi:hypothetical protein
LKQTIFLAFFMPPNFPIHLHSWAILIPIE